MALQWSRSGLAAGRTRKIDEAAKADRILAYQRVRTFDECKDLLAQEMVITATFEIVLDDWRSAPATGLIPMPARGVQPSGSHCVTLCGYDDGGKVLKFSNSWGTNWGNIGFGFLPYSYFERYQLEAWALAARGAPRPKNSGSCIIETTWGIPDYFAQSPLHGFEYFDASHNECVGWAFVVERHGFADIEEMFVHPHYRGKGYGRRLADLILASPNISGRARRLWVSHADRSNVGTPPVVQTLRRLGLSARPASRRWAAYVAM
jgi:GNAT superfamily N-acetyltransferase